MLDTALIKVNTICQRYSCSVAWPGLLTTKVRLFQGPFFKFIICAKNSTTHYLHRLYLPLWEWQALWVPHSSSSSLTQSLWHMREVMYPPQANDRGKGPLNAMSLPTVEVVWHVPFLLLEYRCDGWSCSSNFMTWRQKLAMSEDKIGWHSKIAYTF